ncbi:MAG TPA: hypothetical protein PKW20_07445, partial [Syntrophales bacterium]|nr:hypothetical protein [Syntrophales bacterium]
MSNTTGSPLIERVPTKIGKGCFIAGPTVVYHGVTIGDKVVVLPMSVVTKDIPSYSLVAGSPAKVLKRLTEEFIREEVDRILRKGERET